jgi:dimethylglycine dehydrogenase
MKSSARVVVIGGGVVGCSVLYHLAKNGWSDVMLIERTELTAESDCLYITCDLRPAS